jgi:fibro-slime domain-containing protein
MWRGRVIAALGWVALAAALVWARGQPEKRRPEPPPTMVMSGILRGFRPADARLAHPDFELEPTLGHATYAGIVQDALDVEGKPVFAGTGQRVMVQAADHDGRPIIGPKSYLSARPWDAPAARSGAGGGAATSAARFAQWYRDTPGVNSSRVVAAVLVRKGEKDRYIFEGDLGRGPRSGGYTVETTGAPAEPRQDVERVRGAGGRNFDFTWECGARFTFRAGEGQTLSVAADDDLWVFVDGRLVIDLGGVHAVAWQNFDLDRFAGLEDGKEYSLKLFYAERNRPESRLRIETNLELRGVPLPPVSPLGD